VNWPKAVAAVLAVCALLIALAAFLAGCTPDRFYLTTEGMVSNPRYVTIISRPVLLNLNAVWEPTPKWQLKATAGFCLAHLDVISVEGCGDLTGDGWSQYGVSFAWWR
jgi:hypothetical protein